MGGFEHVNWYGKLLGASMSNLVLLLSSLLPGILVFCFIFWRRLKEDYSSEILFSSSLHAVFYILSFSGIAYYVFVYPEPYIANSIFNPHEMWFWGGVIGYLVGIFRAIRKFSLRRNEAIEASSMALLPWYGMILVSWSLIPLDMFGFLTGVFVLVLFVFSVWLDANRKRVSLLDINKPPFVAYLIFGLLFLARTVVGAVLPDMLSFVGPVDLIFSAVVAFLLLFSVYGQLDSQATPWRARKNRKK